jgi:tRNA (Thr-GGU) A37 N-methylase
MLGVLLRIIFLEALIFKTTVLDIKSYIPELNTTNDIRLGWLTDKIERMNKGKSDYS